MNETYEYDGRRYINPELGRKEQTDFVQNLRAIQNSAMEKISNDTKNLGTQVPSNLGGLGGSEGVWSNRYVTPNTNNTVAQLKTAAQAAALNDFLKNAQAQYQKQYEDAYRAARKRGNRGGGGGGGGGNPLAELDDVLRGMVDFQSSGGTPVDIVTSDDGSLDGVTKPKDDGKKDKPSSNNDGRLNYWGVDLYLPNHKVTA